MDETFNYVKVEVKATVEVLGQTNAGLLANKHIAGESVEMRLIKAGGESIQEIGVTGADGITQIWASFNLYREQPIEFKA